MSSKKDICFGETVDYTGWMSITTNEYARLKETNAKLRAFVEATTKDKEKNEFSPWDYHPTWRALEAQQLLKEIDK